MSGIRVVVAVIVNDPVIISISRDCVIVICYKIFNIILLFLINCRVLIVTIIGHES